MKDIDRKELVTALPRWYEFYEGNVRPYLGKEKENELLCFQLKKLATDIVSHRYSPPFFIIQRYKKSCAGATSLGKQILRFLQLIGDEQVPEALLVAKHVSFAPNLNILIKVLQTALTRDGGFVQEAGQVPGLKVYPEDYSMLLPTEVPDAVKELNTLAAILRKTLRTKKMRDSVKDFRKNATKRYKKAMRVAHQGWIRHRKNLLMRIDWSFKKQFPVVPNSNLSQAKFDELFMQVDQYRKIMLACLRRQFGKDLSFFIWKIECGEIKGLHVHWFIGVNGSKYQDRVNVPRRIAEMWDEAIGRPDTYSFNVNGNFSSHYSGLRVIEYHDPELGEILGRYCDYLTKIDYLMKLRVPEGKRTFGSTTVKETLAPKKGPARKYDAPQINVSMVRGPQGFSKINKNFGKYCHGQRLDRR